MALYDELLSPGGKRSPYEDEPYTLAAGVVIANYEDENKGMVRVQLEQYDKEANETQWLPVASFHAGKEYGAFFLPEVGDEVIVAYLNNNPNAGVVIGSLWGEKNTMPADAPTEKNSIKKIITKAGHQLFFDDEESKGGITVKTKKELTLTLLDEKEVVTITDKDGKNLIEMDMQNGKISIKADSEINIEAKKTINIKGSNAAINIEGKDVSIKGKNVTIEAQMALKEKGQDVKLEGQQVAITGQAGAKVESSAMLTLKGSMTKIN